MNAFHRLLKQVCLLGLCVHLASCGESQTEKQADLLDRIVERKTLVVLTTNQPTTYYIDREDKPAGPEYDMTQAFARSLGVAVKYVEFDSTEAVIEALRNGEGDIAAAGLTITSERSAVFDFGPAVLQKRSMASLSAAFISSMISFSIRRPRSSRLAAV